mmetsp:Transcript_51215/g.69731  ORF Transcript_51215/g.69731 Transcript_51215/m.69731 type:complete len:277 (-) Transcript_51215:93-923(-)|eukprot:CAMPEP_0185773828 /NCGR_PEP_ID=MMETSP1174-20130828/75257_1 /TAXON_ID=35687 /ORGANISM="Dictyocha speculum, Strain CCMP1381" /LENGTH=276 /DNA_ID=CAMNT_0028460691 /DNA_START=124 /DNA_END=954 /DNA_ORIENTATION=+
MDSAEYDTIQILDESNAICHNDGAANLVVDQLKNVTGDRPILVLVLIGKMGHGKSSLGNAILARDCFEARRAAAGVTNGCSLESTTLSDGSGLLVVDTPGLDSTGSEHFSEIVTSLARISKRLGEGAAKFAVLVTMGVHTRMSEDDMASLYAMKCVLGGCFLEQAVLVWTHGDLLDGDEGIARYLAGADEDVQAFVKRPKGGQVVMANRVFSSDQQVQQQNLGWCHDVGYLLQCADRVAGPLLKPRGKMARRLRQAAAREAAAREEPPMERRCQLS